MCKEISPNAVTVCDVAIGDVRAALADEPSVQFEERPFEGTTVSNGDPTRTSVFREKVAAALAGHGGGLAGSPRP